MVALIGMHGAICVSPAASARTPTSSNSNRNQHVSTHSVNTEYVYVPSEFIKTKIRVHIIWRLRWRMGLVTQGHQHLRSHLAQPHVVPHPLVCLTVMATHRVTCSVVPSLPRRRAHSAPPERPQPTAIDQWWAPRDRAATVESWDASTSEQKAEKTDWCEEKTCQRDLKRTDKGSTCAVQMDHTGEEATGQT